MKTESGSQKTVVGDYFQDSDELTYRILKYVSTYSIMLV
jgi:hypothetical protein